MKKEKNEGKKKENRLLRDILAYVFMISFILLLLGSVALYKYLTEMSIVNKAKSMNETLVAEQNDSFLNSMEETFNDTALGYVGYG